MLHLHGTDINGKLESGGVKTPLSDTTQADLQRELSKVRRAEGLPAVMEALYRWELKAGYISKEKLEMNDCYRFFDFDYGLDFFIQINRARSGYTPAPPEEETLPPLHCAICKENVGRPGKENLRIYEFSLTGGTEDASQADFFLQCTPFPVFPYHFVVITETPEPMRVDRQSLEEMARFSDMAPGYTVCSNSDVEGAGSSILAHHHLQVFKGLTLPIMTAGVYKRFQKRGAKVDLLHYPLTAVRVSGNDGPSVIRAAASITEKWKQAAPGENTVNLIFSKNCGTPFFHIIFRNPGYQPSAYSRRYKQEGIGIIEASGFGIFPVPTGPKQDALWEEIRKDGKDIIRDILEGINPIPGGEPRDLIE